MHLLRKRGFLSDRLQIAAEQELHPAVMEYRIVTRLLGEVSFSLLVETRLIAVQAPQSVTHAADELNRLATFRKEFRWKSAETSLIVSVLKALGHIQANFLLWSCLK